MKKRLLLLAVFLLAINFSNAEEYGFYRELSMDINMNNTLDINYLGSSSRIKDLTAELSYFPIKSERQTVSTFEITTKPEADIQVTDKVIISWENIESNKLEFDIYASLENTNLFKKIDNKIDFPIKEDLEDYEQYLKPYGYIDINNDIIDKANEIVEGEDDLYFAVFKLAEWTKDNINYSLTNSTFETVQKSSWVLQNKQGVCDEISNLFISFCRSVGIPARFVSGMAYTNTNNAFGNHGWAEVYFPGYGWMAFDVTYGQFGVIDPSHIEFKKSSDSGESSVTYQWSSAKTEVEAEEMDINITNVYPGRLVDQKVKLDIDLLKKNVDFKSSVPLEVSVTNLNNYYVPVNLFVVQAPSVINKNYKSVLLKPNEEKKVYWIINPPNNLDNGYVYSSSIMVNASYGESDYDIIRYGEEFEHYSLGKAQEQITRLGAFRGKDILMNIDMTCLPTEEEFYSNESVYIECSIKNLGNVNMEGMDVCVRDNCQTLDLGISQEKEVVFDLSLKESKKISVVAEKDDFVRVADVNINIIRIPEVVIVNFEPRTIDYDKSSMFSFSLVSDVPVEDVKVKISNIGDLNISYLEGSQKIEVPIKGKNLREEIEISVEYYSEGKKFEKNEVFHVKINNKPILIIIRDWFLNLI